MKLARLALPALLLVALAGCAGYPPVQIPSGVHSQAADQVREGIIELQNSEHVAAGDRFETAIILDPKLAEAHYNLAIVLDKQGKHAEAEQHLKEAAALAPNNPAIVGSEFYLKHVKGGMR